MTSSSPVTGHRYLDRVHEQPGAILAFAHRGGAEHPDIHGLENTLLAFQHAYDLGYRWFETDVHLSSDGELVAFHDTRLDRVTDGSGLIADLTLAQIRTARVGGREPVPTLEELVEAFPDVHLNIDIKTDPATEPLARFLLARGLADRVMVGGFSPRRLDRFRRLTESTVPTSAHPGEVAAFVTAPTSGLARRLLRGRVAALQVPHRHRVAGLPIEVVNRRLVDRAHEAGMHVHVWTIDDPAQMHELLDLGVDGLMTDRTDVLRAVLLERGRWWAA